MNHETLEASFKDYWETTYPGVTDPVVHRAVRDAFLSGAGHVVISVANMGYERGIVQMRGLLEQWTREMDINVNEGEKSPQRFTRRVPDVGKAITQDES